MEKLRDVYVYKPLFVFKNYALNLSCTSFIQNTIVSILTLSSYNLDLNYNNAFN